MQFNRINYKEHQHFLVVRGFFTNAHVSEFHILFVWGVLVCALSVNLQCCEGRCQLIVQAVFSTPSPLFPLFIQCDGCLFPFPVWGLTAGLPGFASHGRSLHLGAGCQQLLWKLLDVLGIQPPLNDAVVKSYFFKMV